MSTLSEEQKSKLHELMTTAVAMAEEKASEMVVDGAIKREEIKPMIDFVKFSLIHLMENLGLFLSEYLEDVSTKYARIGANKVSRSLTSVVLVFSYIFFGGIAVCFFAVGGALLLGNLLGSASAGFFAVGALVVVMAITFYALRKKLVQKPLESVLIHQWVQDWEKEREATSNL